MADTLRALSIRQPWAWALLHANKTVENRDWPRCDYRGPLLLHASKGCTRDEYACACESIQAMRADAGLEPLDVPELIEQPRGALVGIARIVRVDRHPEVGVKPHRGHDGVVRELDWARGYRGFRIAGALGLQLGDIRELPPIPWRGALGFFGVPVTELPGEYMAAWHELAAKGGAR